MNKLVNLEWGWRYISESRRLRRKPWLYTAEM